MMRRLFLGLLVVAGPACAPDVALEQVGTVASAELPAESPGAAFTLEQVERFHREFDPTFTEWALGGELTRYVYLNTSEFWPQIVVRRSGEPHRLPVDSVDWIGARPVTVDAGRARLQDYVSNSAVDGAIVLVGGRIVFESYPRMSPRDRHIWFSVSKTVVSTAVAILEDRGLVDVTQPVEVYLPDLGGTAWAGTPVIDILDMASGIDCPEVLSEAESCFWEFFHAYGWPETDPLEPDPIQELVEMGRAVPSGQLYDYTSVDTEVLNWLVEEVSGRRYSDFVEAEIWAHVGAAWDAHFMATSRGRTMSAGGVSTTLRDLARYGLLFTPHGRQEGTPVVSDAMLESIVSTGRPELTAEAQRAAMHQRLGDDSFGHSTRQWDLVTTDGDFFKSGFGGQGLYVSPANDLVVAWFGTPTEGRTNEMLKIARQLATSGGG